MGDKLFPALLEVVMRWRGAMILAAGLLWPGAGWAGLDGDEFGSVGGDYRHYETWSYCEASSPPPPPPSVEACPTALAALCGAITYAGEARDSHAYRISLAEALRRQGLPGRAAAIDLPHKTRDAPLKPLMWSEFQNPLFRPVIDPLRQALDLAACDREGARHAFQKAEAAVDALDPPARAAALAHLAYHQGRNGFAAQAAATFRRLQQSGLPDQDMTFPNPGVLRGSPLVARGIPDIVSVYRSVAMAAAELGHLDLAVKYLPQQGPSVAHLVAQIALIRGRPDIALDLARAEDIHRQVIYQALIRGGYFEAVRAIIESRRDSSLVDFDQMAATWAASNPLAAAAYMRKRDHRHIATKQITTAALVCNARGALALAHGASGIVAFRKFAGKIDDRAKRSREYVDFAAAMARTAVALADAGRRRDGLALLAEVAPLFAGEEFYAKIGWPTRIVAEAYAHLGEPGRGLRILEANAFSRRERLREAEQLAEWRRRMFWHLVSDQAYGLAHAERFAASLALLRKYPDYRDAVLSGFAYGARDARTIRPLSHQLETGYLPVDDSLAALRARRKAAGVRSCR
jgi:hypothetical protein